MQNNDSFELQLQRMERIQSINHELVANRSLDEILHQIVRITTELLDCDDASLCLLNESSNTLRFMMTNASREHLFNIEVPMQSIIGTSFTSGESIIVDDVQSDPRFYPEADKLANIVTRTLLVVPLKFRDRKIGVLYGINKKRDQHFNASDVQALTALASQATIAIENARLYQKAQDEIAERIKVEEELIRHRDHLEELVKERTAEIHQLAIKDGLTDVFNRRHLYELGKRALLQAQRYQHPLSAMLLDLDHFKTINDTYGHAIGDDVLREFANLMRRELRSIDIIGRYGGEEFVVLMPETNLEMAYQSAERLLLSIRTLHIHTSQAQFGLTVSIGVAELNQEETLDDLIAHADNALYTAKQTGRNKVVVWQAE